MNIQELPSEIIITIFNYINENYIYNVMLTCKQWYNHIEYDRLWYNYYIKLWDYPSKLMLNKYHINREYCNYNNNGKHTIYGQCWKQLYRKKRNLDKFNCSVYKTQLHGDGLRCLKYDNDLDRLITGSYDKLIKIYNLTSLNQKAVLVGHNNWILCLQTINNLLISGSMDKTIKIWNLEKYKYIATLEGHNHAVESMTMNQNKLYSGSFDKNVIGWDVNTLQKIRVIEAHDDKIRYVESFDGGIITCSDDTTIKLWNKSLGYIGKINGHSDRVHCIRTDNNIIVSGGADLNIKLWDMRNFKCLMTIKNHQHCIRHLQFDKSKIISGGWDNMINIWSLNMNHNIRNLYHESHVAYLQYDDEKIISSDHLGNIYKWSL